MSERLKEYVNDWVAAYKHRLGQHNQKRHGWRGAGLDAVQRAMRSGISEDFAGRTTPEMERDAARAKFGLKPIDRAAMAAKRQAPQKGTGPRGPMDYRVTPAITIDGKRYEFAIIEKHQKSIGAPLLLRWHNAVGYNKLYNRPGDSEGVFRRDAGDRGGPLLYDFEKLFKAHGIDFDPQNTKAVYMHDADAPTPPWMPTKYDD